MIAFAFTGSTATADAGCKGSACEQKPSKPAKKQAPKYMRTVTGTGKVILTELPPGAVAIKCHGVTYWTIPIVGYPYGSSKLPPRCN